MDSASLWITGLGELAAIQSLVIIVGFFALRKYKRRCRELSRGLKQAKQSTPVLNPSVLTPSPMRRVDSGPMEASALLFLQRQAHQSHVRLLSNNERDRVSQDNFAPVWALRKCYLKAEVEALSSENEGGDAYWTLLERRLTALIGKMSAAGQEQESAAQWQKRVEILRERLVHLKAVETDCKQAQQALSASRQRIVKLEQLAVGQQASRDSADKIAALNHMVQRTGSGHYSSVSDAYGDSRDDTDLLTNRLREQRQLIESLTRKIRSYELSEVGEDDRLLTDAQVGQLARQVSILERDLQDSERLIERLNASVAKLRAGPSAGAEAGQHLQLVKNHQDEDIRIIGARAADPDPCGGDYLRAQEDIERLNDIITRQKRAIEKFSAELSALRLEVLGSSSKDEMSGKVERIGRLERLLGESQTCVGMLERELYDVQSQLQALDTDTKATTPTNDTDIERSLDAEIASMEQMLSTTMKAYADQSHLTQLAMQGANCKSFHELGRELLDCLNDLGVGAAVHLKGDAELVDVFDKNKISVVERKQLKQVDLLSAARVTEVPAGFVVVFPNVSCLVKSNLLEGDRCTEIKDLTTSMLSLVSMFASKIDSDVVIGRQRKALDQLVRTAHKTVKDIDVQYKYQSGEATLAIDSFMKEVYMAVRSMDLREADREIFLAMVGDCQERMALLFATGLTIDNTMQRLLETFEKRQG